MAWPLGRHTPEGRSALRAGLVALAAFGLTYGAVRLAVGSSFYIEADGKSAGSELFAHNVGRGVTWDNVFQTLNILPLLALLAIRRWPPELKVFGAAVVPAWFAIHGFTSVLAESRLVLVPLVLVFVPGVLAGLGASAVAASPRQV
jgi:hypothetical protein